MLSVSNTLKTTALAALLGIGAAVTAAAPASADTITTRCFGDDCYRVRCDDAGFDCVRYNPAYDRDYYDYSNYSPYSDYRVGRTQWVCDSFGDNCHYATVPGYYDAFGVWHADW
jgi:hypothetical protein